MTPGIDERGDDMIDILSAELGESGHRLTRGGFAATLIYAAIFFFSTLFAAATVMGFAALFLEIGFGLTLSDDLLIRGAAVVLAFASGAMATAAGASRLRDTGRSPIWLAPVAFAYALFVLSRTGLVAAPDVVVSASAIVIAAGIVVLCLLPGRATDVH
ncbi:MAG: hypothetical protein VYD64_02090 [Pseudomonadota bacterium]|nr:hypothetical protein [Pseudomonadota bacterium]